MQDHDEYAAKVIGNLGGPTKVARLLEAADMGSERPPWTPQRVQNWLKRGIPPRVQLHYSHVIAQATNSPQPQEVTHA